MFVTKLPKKMADLSVLSPSYAQKMDLITNELINLLISSCQI